MRKRIFWVGIIALFLLVLALLAACQLLPNRNAAALVPTITPLHIIQTEAATPAVAPTLHQPTRTAVVLPTATPEPAQPPTVIPTVPPTASPMPYQLQVGAQRYIPAFTRSDQGCAWSGIAGQVFDASGNGVSDVIVMITGKVDGKSVDQVGITEAQSAYGPGGYEMTLADHLPVADEGLIIQLFDSKGHAITGTVYFRMPTSCDHNLVLMNFQALYPLQQSFLPMVGQSQ